MAEEKKTSGQVPTFPTIHAQDSFSVVHVQESFSTAHLKQAPEIRNLSTAHLKQQFVSAVNNAATSQTAPNTATPSTNDKKQG